MATSDQGAADLQMKCFGSSHYQYLCPRPRIDPPDHTACCRLTDRADAYTCCAPLPQPSAAPQISVPATPDNANDVAFSVQSGDLIRMNSIGSALGNGTGTGFTLQQDLIRSTSIMPAIQHSDAECCTWVAYVALFIVGAVIVWCIITSIVVVVTTLRRSDSTPRWLQTLRQCRQKSLRRNTKTHVKYQPIFHYNVAEVPVVSDLDRGTNGSQDPWFGRSMTDYVSDPEAAPVPTCPRLAMNPRRKGEMSRRNRESEDVRTREDSRKHNDQTIALWRYFPKETSADGRDESLNGEGDCTDIDLKWDDHFRCNITTPGTIQPTNKPTLEEIK